MRLKRCRWAVLAVTAAVLLLVAGFWGWLFAEAGALSEFVRNAILVGAGAVLGIPAGLRMNRRWEESQADVKRQQLLRASRAELMRNAELLPINVRTLNRHVAALPTQHQPVGLLGETLSARYELLDLEVAVYIDHAYFALSRVNAQLGLKQAYAAAS